MNDSELVNFEYGDLETILFKYFNVKGNGLINRAKKVEDIIPNTILQKLKEISVARNQFTHRKRSTFPSDIERERFKENVKFVKDELINFNNFLNLQAIEFSIFNKHFNQTLDCWKRETESWQLHCWREWHKNRNQRFLINQNKQSNFIALSESGHCLDTFYSENSWKLHLWQYHGGANQQWKLTRLEDFSYKIESIENGLCLDAWSNSDNDEVYVHLYQWHGGDNQRWWITPYL